jgi:exodeoxyribonuclease VII small subunit
MTEKHTSEPINFETALKDLEGIVQKMETGQLSLEDSLKSFESGIALARLCQDSLKSAEHKVQILLEQNGELKGEPFLVDD